MKNFPGSTFQDLTIYVNHNYDWKKALIQVTDAFPDKKIIVTEGDSWFAYPSVFNRPTGNVVDWLERIIEHGIQKFIFLRLESLGDEAVDMLLKHQSRLEEVLSINVVKKRIVAILFSGGGNDIVGRGDMPRFLIQNNKAKSFEENINKDAYAKMLQYMNLAYENLIKIRNDSVANCPVITHTYAYIYPSDKGFDLPPFYRGKAWMKPYMDILGITKPSFQKDIAKYFIDEFAKSIINIKAKNFFVLDNREKLNSPNLWINEIHPTSKGFKIITDSFLDQLHAIGVK